MMRSAKLELSLRKNKTARPQGWSNPVVPGDHPDPTIVLVNGVFWASATSGEWSPQFPLFCSTDLVGWEPAGSIFPRQPEWAEGSFWAPELVHDELSGRFLVWYVGKKRGGQLCIAVATAEQAGGPYEDRGPLICEEDGSIDPCFARDEHGEPYLIWKEDGNSQGRPTPIWAQRLAYDLLGLEGEKTMLIVNDQAWEEGVVEGPYIQRRQGWFYMFYAGNSCCGKECKYAEGVARSEKLLGPWEKFSGNPIIGANDNWRCPGHGTSVHTADKDGRAGQDYFLYHSYPVGGTVYVGREAVLDEILWSGREADGRPGWPSINAGGGPGETPTTPALPIEFVDALDGETLGPSWQWPVNTFPEVSFGDGLTMRIPLESPLSDQPVESALLAVPHPTGLRYRVSVGIALPTAPDAALWAGLAIVGDPFNTIGLGLRGERLALWQRRGGWQEVLWDDAAPQGEVVWLRCDQVGGEHLLQFFYSGDGEAWREAGGPCDASDLPAWDRGLRVGLMMEGPRGSSARYREFELKGS